MHVMQEQIDACNAIMIFGVHEFVIQVILLDQIMGAKLSVYTLASRVSFDDLLWILALCDKKNMF